MQVPQIRIQTTDAKLGINTKQASLNIEQPKADVSIEQPQADIQYDRRPPKLTIDQTEAWEAMGIKSVPRSIEGFVQNAKQDWFTGLSRVAQQGDELMKIENGDNPIARQGQVNSEPKQYEFNIGFIPPNFSVKFNYNPGDLQINVSPQKPIIDVTPRKPQISYNAGSVDIYIAQKKSIKFEVVGNEVDSKY
jgi:hypothetical protein